MESGPAPSKDDKITELENKFKSIQSNNSSLNENLEKERIEAQLSKKKLEELREILKNRDYEVSLLQYVLDAQTKELNDKIEDLNKISELDLDLIQQENNDLTEKRKALELENTKFKNIISNTEDSTEESKEGTPKLLKKGIKEYTVDEIAQKVKVEKDAFGVLTTRTISMLFDAVCEYGYPRYYEQMLQLRKERRALGDELEPRTEIANKYTKIFNKIFEELQKELLAKLNLTQEDLFGSIESHAAKGDTQVLYLFQMLTEKMRMMKKGDKFLNKDTVKAILEFKRDCLVKSIERIRKLADAKKDDKVYLEALYVDFSTQIYDEIQKYFGYEEEDMVSGLALQEVSFDMEINSLLIEIDNLMKSVLPHYVPVVADPTPKGEKKE